METRYIKAKYKTSSRPKSYGASLSLTGEKGATGYPHVLIKVNNTEYYNGIVQDKRIIDFTVNELDKKQELTITLINKSPNKDTIVKDGKIVMDKLVKIEKIVLDEVDIKENVFEATYKPIYPEPWATQQREQGIELLPIISMVTALGYNGTWTFCYENSPVYYFAQKRHAESPWEKRPYTSLVNKKYIELTEHLR